MFDPSRLVANALLYRDFFLRKSAEKDIDLNTKNNNGLTAYDCARFSARQDVIEMIEKKHRIEDALEAVRSAQEQGIVSGGGSALLHASVGLEVPVGNQEQQLGVRVVLDAMRAPLTQMCANAGESSDMIVSAVCDSQTNQAYDFMKRDVVDAIETGLIDPVKVTISALTNAVSVASTLITTNHAIVKQ